MLKYQFLHSKLAIESLPWGSFETEHKVTCLFFRQEDGEFLNEARSFAKLGFTQYMYVDSIHLS